jgi:hypothetical protein
MIAGLLGICRCFGLRIHSITVKALEKTTQFSIRHLMLLTLAVACLCAAAKWLHVDIRAFPVLALIASLFVILGLVAVWAILGTKHTTPGLAALSLLAALVGTGLALVVSDAEVADLWIVATMTGALLFVVSLCVIRRCGFRVRRQPKGELACEGEQPQKEHECGK